MQYTTNLNLNKPEASDYADIAKLNENMDTLDAAVAGKVDADGLADAVKGQVQSGGLTAADLGAVDADDIGQPGGVAQLGSDGKVPAAQLPEMDYAPSEHTHSADDVTSGIFPLTRGGTGAGDAQAARANLDVARPVRAEVSFPASGWKVSDGAYRQTVSCAVAAETMRYANIGPKYSTDAAARELEQEAYACIAYVDTADGQLAATCWDGTDKPEVNLTLIFEGGAA